MTTADQKEQAVGLIRKTLCAASLAAVAAMTLSACGGGASHPTYHDALTCRSLATATTQDQLTGDYGNMLSARADVLAQQAVTTRGYLSPSMRQDVKAVVDTGLNNPSQDAVDQLQAACAAVGVRKQVWPDALTGN